MKESNVFASSGFQAEVRIGHPVSGAGSIDDPEGQSGAVRTQDIGRRIVRSVVDGDDLEAAIDFPLGHKAFQGLAQVSRPVVSRHHHRYPGIAQAGLLSGKRQVSQTTGERTFGPRFVRSFLHVKKLRKKLPNIVWAPRHMAKRPQEASREAARIPGPDGEPC